MIYDHSDIKIIYSYIQDKMNSVLANQPSGEIYGEISYPKIFKWTRIIVFQFLVSMIYTYAIMCSYYNTSINGLIVPNPGHSGYISLALFLCLVLAGQLTGGHTNPIITISLLMSKGNNITIVNAVIYIVSQFAGSFLGATIAYVVVLNYGVAEPGLNYSIQQAFGGQAVGSFLLCIWLLVMMNQQTTFVKNNFWHYILLPVLFYVCREITYQINGLNPAAVLANQVFFGVKYGVWSPLQNYWAYIVGPVIGSVLAGLFFNYSYLPLFMRWKSRK